MYKALERKSGAPVVILAESQRRIEEKLRDWGRDGRLLCPGCRTKVEVRNGAINRAHFAHFHLDNCPLDEIPAPVEEAKALLYEWLRAKYGANLTYEYRAPHASELPRPIDLRVKNGNGGAAFWVVGKGMNPPGRTLLQKTLRASVDHARYVFTEDMLHEKEREKGEPRVKAGETARLKLTKTERVFLRRTPYDSLHKGDFRSGKGKTLSYLLAGSRPGEDGKPPRMRTYRSLRRVHKPAIYRGVAKETPLEDLKVMRSTGRVVHPGEHKALLRLREKQKERQRRKEAEEARATRRRKERRAERERFKREFEDVRGTDADGSGYLRRLKANHGPDTAGDGSSSASSNLSGSLYRQITCIKCGRETTSWSVSYGDGTGVCREC